MRRRRNGTDVRAIGVHAGGAGVCVAAIKGNAAWRAPLKKERTIGCGCRTVGKRGGWVMERYRGRDALPTLPMESVACWRQYCGRDTPILYIGVAWTSCIFFSRYGIASHGGAGPSKWYRMVAAAATARPRLRYGMLFTKCSRSWPGIVDLVVNQYFCANLFFLCSRVDWAATK